jgi:hypothetical protein
MKIILLATLLSAIPALARDWGRPIIIASAYHVILGRDADRGGFCSWMEFEGTYLNLQEAFTHSDEFWLKYGIAEDNNIKADLRKASQMHWNAFGRRPTTVQYKALLSDPDGAFHAIITSKEYETVAKTLKLPCCGRNCK